MPVLLRAGVANHLDNSRSEGRVDGQEGVGARHGGGVLPED
jgi:hypothetical protein